MKIIKVTCCADCPYYGECKAWKALTRKQRVTLTIGNGIPHDMILKACPLDDESLVPESTQD